MPFESILCIKLADLGDVLVTEPALRSLRTAYPAASIDILTTPAAASLVPMIAHDVNVIPFNKHRFDSLRAMVTPAGQAELASISLELRRRRYDAVAIFHHLTTPAGAVKFRALAAATGSNVIAGLDNGRGEFLTHPVDDLGFGRFHEAEYMLAVARKVGGHAVSPAPRIPEIPDATLELVVEGLPPLAIIFPVTGPYAPGRNWPAGHFASLAALLQKRGMQPVVAGADDAAEAASAILDAVPGAIDLSGRTSLPELVNLVSSAAVVITGDSFPGHLAAAVGTPVASIFGPSNHLAWGPLAGDGSSGSGGKSVRIIRNDVPCAPCLYTGYRLGRRDGCSSRICLTEIAPEDVMNAVESLIGKYQ